MIVYNTRVCPVDGWMAGWMGGSVTAKGVPVFFYFLFFFFLCFLTCVVVYKIWRSGGRNAIRLECMHVHVHVHMVALNLWPSFMKRCSFGSFGN